MLNAIGLICHTIGQYDNAISSFRKIQEIRADYVDAVNNEILCLMALGLVSDGAFYRMNTDFTLDNTKGMSLSYTVRNRRNLNFWIQFPCVFFADSRTMRPKASCVGFCPLARVISMRWLICLRYSSQLVEEKKLRKCYPRSI